jgi:hypothetical protein
MICRSVVENVAGSPSYENAPNEIGFPPLYDEFHHVPVTVSPVKSR